MIYLRKVNVFSLSDTELLWALLEERTSEQSISHKLMPTFGEHVKFIRSCPYKAWYIIGVDGVDVGATYITHNNELGIGILAGYSYRGYGKTAVQEVMKRYEGPFLANINPNNAASIMFFENLGFKLLQVTYAK